MGESEREVAVAGREAEVERREATLAERMEVAEECGAHNSARRHAGLAHGHAKDDRASAADDQDRLTEDRQPDRHLD